MPRFPAFFRLRVLAVVLAAVAGVACVVAFRRPTTLVDAVAREVREIPVAGIRVSIASPSPDCARESPRSSFRICDAADVGPLPRRRLHSIARQANRTAEATADGDALHASGLLRIFIGSDRDTAALDGAIADLRVASVLNERPAPALADLSAAYLARAERTHTAQDLFKALEASEQALEIDPGNLAARFNDAMALDRAGLRRQAIQEWRRYLAADSVSAYARLASRRLRELAVPPRLPLMPPPRSAPPADFAKYTALFPLRARDLAWDQLLGEWGIAVLIRDTATARLRLAQAEAIGSVLVSQGRDPSLMDEVRAVQQHASDAGSIQRAATAHMAFASGRAAARARRFSDARAAFSRALELGGFGPMRAWAEIQYANFWYSTGMPEHNALIRDLAIRSDSLRYPTISGTLWRQLGFMLQWQAHHEESKVHLRRAIRLLHRAGEDDEAFETLAVLGFAEMDSNNRDAGYELAHQALVGLGRYPASAGVALNGLADATAADGLHRAALRVRDEAVSLWDELPDPSRRSQARIERAKQRLAAGRMDIDADLQASLSNIASLDFGDLLWLTADNRQLHAEQRIASNPLAAAATLDSLATLFASNPWQRVQLRLLAAEARLAAGRLDAADADLRSVIATLDTTDVHIGRVDLRNWLLQNAPLVFDRAVMASLRAGRPDRALDYMDQRRAALSSVSRAVGWSVRPPATRPREVAVELALVGDTLLAWTLSGGTLSLYRRTVDRAELVRTVERARFALETRSGRAARPALEALYDQLVRPIRSRLGTRGTPLVIVADGVLSTIPIAALRNREDGRYLVEDHPLRIVSSLRDPIHVASPPARGPVTLIADPTFDRRAYPELSPLRSAVGEVTALSRLYPGAQLLVGSDARAEAIEIAFRRGGIVHFAGHAIVNNERPERSTLAIASTGSSGRDTLTAREIERMDLRNLRIVILAACETAWAPAARSGGFAGLAGAFLAAGAGGVVGSLWRVDDDGTRVLMEAFHRAYLVSGNGPQALRQAQLELLQSGDPAFASPGAWAAFEYVGS